MARGRKATAGEKTGHRKAAGEAEPLSTSLVPIDDSLALREPPPDLEGPAADAWRICVAEMAGNRHVREADLLVLRSYVLAIHVHEEASEIILKKGVMVMGPMGAPIANPMIKVRNDAANQIRYLSDILGLNPLSRIRQNLAEVAGQSMVLDIRDRLIADITSGR